MLIAYFCTLFLSVKIQNENTYGNDTKNANLSFFLRDPIRV